MASPPNKYVVLVLDGKFAIGEWTIDEDEEDVALGHYLVITQGILDKYVAQNIANGCLKERPEHGNYL